MTKISLHLNVVKLTRWRNHTKIMIVHCGIFRRSAQQGYSGFYRRGKRSIATGGTVQSENQIFEVNTDDLISIISNYAVNYIISHYLLQKNDEIS